MLSNVFLHLHPVRIRKSGVKLRYTWCMGGLSFFLFLSLTFTGLLLMFYYRPTLEYAYTDIVGLREHVPLGIMREMHRWGAHAMVITVWLHMFRVFMTGSYKPPREFNWSVGVIMLVLTLLLSFTGYLLPWDQLAIWAITVGSNMARATPFLGHEGPGANLRARRRPADPRGRRRAVRAARRHVRRRRRAAAVLRAALRRPAARHRRADGGPLLARPQRRRHHATLRRSSGASLKDHQRRRRPECSSSAVVGARCCRLEARAGRVQRVRLRPARAPGGVLRVRHVRPELPLIVTKPDNVPIVGLIFLLVFFVWYSRPRRRC